MNPWDVLGWIILGVFAVPVLGYFILVGVVGISVLAKRVEAYQRRHNGR